MPSRTTPGFTLMELMIAVSLGMLIVYAAVAGFRVASQTVTNANRLALENSLLRAGFHQALDEIDFWTAYDDPDSTVAADQSLRRSQMPFSALPGLVSISPSMTPVGKYTYPSPEGDTGWDAFYLWPANDSRTWWRANPAEWNNSIGRSGKYADFASTSGAPHTWLFSQMDMLHSSLGYYAFVDYLPPSMLYAYIKGSDLEPTFVKASSFRNGDGGAEFPQGRYRCTKDTSYLLTPLEPSGGTTLVTASANRSKYSTGVGTNSDEVAKFMRYTLSSRPQIGKERAPGYRQPANWPLVTLEVARFISHNRFVVLNKVKWSSPITGEPLELSFTAIGTTLRGARQQRKPGAPGDGNGWAKWYGPNESYGAGDGQNSMHLDYNPK
jgi:hypothetical protein